jgi:ribosomal protein S18 acetylase RimI-like enzyme
MTEIAAFGSGVNDLESSNVNELIQLQSATDGVESLNSAVLETDRVDGGAALDSDTQLTGNRISPQRIWNTAKRAGQMAVALTVLSPVNEVIRGSVIVPGYLYSHNPAVGALTAGISTLAVEGAGALASAGLFSEGNGGRFFAKVNNKLKKVNPEGLSPIAEAGVALTLGTVAAMAVKQSQDPTRDVHENRKYGLITSAWLAGAAAIGGALATEGMDTALEKPQVALPMVAGVAVVEGLRRGLRKLRTPKKVKDIETEQWQDRDKHYSYHLATDPTELQAAAKTEAQVWQESKFGKLDGYAENIAHSRTFAAFNEQGECIGVTRMFGAKENTLPPFLTKMPFDDENRRTELLTKAQQGDLEELGTVAVLREARGKGVNTRLWRLAYRDAVARDVKEWGIIMEPERVAKMNKRHGFTFEQLGPVREYQGGECAAFVMSLDGVARNMQRKAPLQHFWFARKALKP